MVLLAILALPNLVYLTLAGRLPATWRITFLAFDLALISLPFFLLPGRIKYFLALPFAAISPLEVLQIALMKVPSTAGVLGSVMDTNPRESLEFVTGTLPWSVVAGASSLLAIAATVRAWRSPKSTLGPRGVAIFLVANTMAFAAQGIHIVRESRDVETALDLSRIEGLRTYPFGLAKKVQELVRDRIRLDRRARTFEDFDWKLARTPDTLGRTIVLVVGESSRAANWGIYGYSRETTPRLVAMDGLATFHDAVSNANMTRESIPLMLGLATPTNPGIFDSTPSILNCLRQGGYHVSWLSNQGAYGSFSAKPTMIGHEADTHVFLGADLANESKNGFDEVLLPLLSERLAGKPTRKLIVLHTMGSHFDYRKRSPRKFWKFPQDLATGADIGAYDNSILYTDWLLASIADTLAARSEPTALVYVSDHGEALGEDCGQGKSFIHGTESPCPVEYRIPLLVWLSPQWRDLHPEQARNLFENRLRRVSAKNIPATLAGIAGIVSGRLDSSENLAGDRFVERDRHLITPSGKVLAIDGR